MSADLPTMSWATAVAQVLGARGAVAGAAFLAEDTVVVTCAHVVEAAGGGVGETVALRFSQAEGAPVVRGQVAPGGWAAPDAADIAVILLESKPLAVSPLPLADSGGCRGRDVSSFGYPGQAGPDGHFGYARAGDVQANRLQLTAANDLTQGFSGAPLWDETTGAVVGMVTQITRPDRHQRGTGIAYATSTAAIRALWPDLALVDVCPYLGLEPFTAAHVDWYHGRADAVQSVLDRLQANPQALLLLGPSGAGKSSLVQAGVVPALAAGRLPGSDRWQVTLARPGTALTNALTCAMDGTDAARQVIVVDQFEEILTPRSVGEAPEPAQPDAIEQLTAAIGTPGLSVLLVMRDDFYPRLAAEAGDLLRIVTPGLVNLPATLSRQELHDIITEPARTVGARCQDGLAERIIADVLAAEPGGRRPASTTVLPLLEVTLEQLWLRNADGVLTHDAYQRIGGLTGSISAWCDAAVVALSRTDLHRRAARQVLTALVRPADPVQHIPAVRRQRPIAELRDIAGTGDPDDDTTSSAAADEVLDILSRHRLIITSTNGPSGTPVAELVHDTLISDWAELRDWLDEERIFQRWLHRATERHQIWQTRHDREDLLLGGDLKEGLKWSAGRRLPSPMAVFLATSRRVASRTTWVRRALAASLALVALSAAGVAIRTAADAGHQRAVALSRRLTAQSQNLQETQPVTARRLAIAAWQSDRTAEAGRALTTLLAQQQSVLVGHTGAVKAVAFSPDGAQVASGGDDGTVRLWRAATGQPATAELTGHRRPVTAVAFNPSGTVLASASQDRTVLLWDPSTGRRVGRPLVGHDRDVISVGFTPDGAGLVTVDLGGTMRRWNAQTGDETAAPVTLDTGGVTGVAFSSDGRRLASIDGGGVARLRDPATGAAVGSPLQLQHGWIRSVAFDKTGTVLATGGTEGAVDLWDPVTGRHLHELIGHERSVLSVTFSPDGTRLMATGLDATVRLWDPRSGAPVHTATVGRDTAMWAASFTADGHVVASAGGDGTVRLWDSITGLPTTVPLPSGGDRVLAVAMAGTATLTAAVDDDHTVRLSEAATGWPVGVPLAGSTEDVLQISADPKLTVVATTGKKGVARLWNPSTGREIAALLADSGQHVWVTAVSPDGTRVATAGDSDAGDGDAVDVWDARTGVKIYTIDTGQGLFVRTLTFTPDGRRLVSTGTDRGVRFWDAATGAAAGQIRPASASGISTVGLDPAGTRIAVGGTDVRVDLWNADTLQTIRRLTVVGAPETTGLTFTSGGRLLATADADGRVRFWDPATGDQVGTPLTGHTGKVSAMALSADGTLLETIDEHSEARLWYVPLPQVALADFCARYGLPNDDEWHRYAPGERRPDRPCIAGDE